MSKVKEFKEYRLKINKAILQGNNKVVKRLFSVDTVAYNSDALNTKIKKMLGLVSSLVLRCANCVKYHLKKLNENGATNAEIHEIFGIGVSIVIPHTKRAV